MPQPESKFIQANGIRLHYLDWGGTGPTCVLIHGGNMCGGSWEPIVNRLGNRLHCIAPDIRDHGDSQASTGNVTWEMVAADFVGFYKALDLSNILLVGHSRGGSAALLSASMSPERFAGSYFVEPSLFLKRREPVNGQTPRGPREAPKQRRTFASQQALYDAYRGRGAMRKVTDESLWAFVNYGTRVREDGLVEWKCTNPHQLGIGVPEFAWDALGHMPFPVALAFGEESILAPDVDAITRAAKTAPVTYEIVQGTHNTTMEFPDFHAAKILAMADQLKRDGKLKQLSAK